MLNYASQTAIQVHKSTLASQNVEDFFGTSIFIPFLNSDIFFEIILIYFVVLLQFFLPIYFETQTETSSLTKKLN